MQIALPLLRLFAAILRVVALVVLVPVLAQAHAGHDHAARIGSGHVHKVAAQSFDAVGPSVASAAVAPETASDRADCPACRSCCCGHVFVAVPDVNAGRADRLSSRRFAMGPDDARPSAVTEALPEPPRPFA